MHEQTVSYKVTQSTVKPRLVNLCTVWPLHFFMTICLLILHILYRFFFFFFHTLKKKKLFFIFWEQSRYEFYRNSFHFQNCQLRFISMKSKSLQLSHQWYWWWQSWLTAWEIFKIFTLTVCWRSISTYC